MNKELKFTLKYAGELFSQDVIKNLLSVIETLLNQIATTPHLPSQSLRYLGESQYNQIVYKWNETEKGYPQDKTIQALFEEQVERTPSNIAVVYKGTQLTYRELNERANQVAHFLKQQHDIKPDTLITLCLDRSEHMLISILAILKAGGAYVPMDPGYPDERIEYILKDTETSIILTNEIYKERLEALIHKGVDRQRENKVTVIGVDSFAFQTMLETQPVINLALSIPSTCLAYVIYTSGTTGHPKGVMIQHDSIINRIKWMNNSYPLTQEDKILQKTPYIFDVSVWELFWANWYGACIVFAEPEKHKDANYVIDLIFEQSITITHFVPSMLSVFIDTLHITTKQPSVKNSLPSLVYIFCSGEALTLTQVQQCHRILPTTEVHNLYGPTEASVDVLFYNCTDKNIEDVYIGKQIDNTTAYVLARDLRVLPIGAIGELYIGGVGLARGYLNKPELTAEKFILNPFQTEEEKKAGKNARLYKTGDLVRWLPDGNLEYIGRNDFQVKIRGYRIELGEIENTLLSYEGITQSVVLAKDHVNAEGIAIGNKYLVGYYVSERKLQEEDILSYLSSKLPDYMIPSVLVHLESLPLTVNGKLDRKALPDPELTNQETYVAPRNELEEKVCQIWSEVLGLTESKVSIHDDFFRLGGDSIVSIQLVSKLRQKLGLKHVSVKDIFTYRSIEKLYDNVLSKQANENAELKIRTEQGLLGGEVPLLPIQEWFFERGFAKAHHWNQSFLLRTPALDLEKLQQSIIKLVQHHDNLRLRYKKTRDWGEAANINKAVYTQYYNSEVEDPRLQTLNVSHLKSKEGTREFEIELQKVLTDWQSKFNLEEGPLYSIGYIHGYTDGSSRVYFALHHLIVDSVSWRILAEDLRDLYNGKDLGEKGSSYRQWVTAVKDYGKTHENERAYWDNILSDYDRSKQGLIQLGIHEEQENHALLELSQEETQRLLKESHKAYNTQINDILLTALGHTLSQFTKSRVNHVVLEGHGREEIDECVDITRTVGWFTTMYPVRLETSEEFGDSLKMIKETLRQVPHRGIGYGALKGYSSDCLPRISFNYLGQFDQDDQGDQKKSLWEIVDEKSGNTVDSSNRDYNILNINGLVIGGKLKFTIASKFDQQTTEALAQLFKSNLNNIIEYSASYTRSYLTVSDLGSFEAVSLETSKSA